MHIPSYARATIRAALPTVPTARHTAALDCSVCGEPFGDSLRVPLGPTETSGLFACHSCITGLVALARRRRDESRMQTAEQRRREQAAWTAEREDRLVCLDNVRRAAESVTKLAADETVEPQRIAWLHVSLESAFAWATESKVLPPPSVASEDPAMKDAEFDLTLQMLSAREAVADRLAYHVINESRPAEPEMCADFECPDDCSGRHDLSQIDCGPDAIFADLAEYGR